MKNNLLILKLTKSVRFISILLLTIPCLFPTDTLHCDDRLFSAYIEDYPNGRIDWDNGIIYGVGRGYLHRNGGNKNRALRAARVIALQSILKVAAGIRLDAKNTLATLGGGKVVIHLRALIRHKEHKTVFVENIKQPYFEITLQAPCRGVEGLTSRLLTKLKSIPADWRTYPRKSLKHRALNQKVGQQTFLVLDARKLPSHDRIKPALFPQITSSDGEIIYHLTNVDETAFVEKGMARYVESAKPRKQFSRNQGFQDDILVIVNQVLGVPEVYAAEGKKRKKRRKFIVTEVKQAQGLNKTNLVISAADAKELKEQDQASQILKQCRVIVVVSSPIGGIEGSLSPYMASVFQMTD